MDDSPESTTIQALRDQLGDRYDRYDDAEQARHGALARSIRRPADVALEAVERGERRWTVTVSAADGIGALSIIAGLFTAYRLDILTADVFTVKLPTIAPERRPERVGAARRWGGPRRPPPVEPRAPARVLLDIFDVRALGEVGPDLWERFRADLASLVALIVAGPPERARDELIDRVSAAFQALGEPGTPLLPISIELANDPGAAPTRLTVRSVDTPGFLFAFTNALAGFTINIEQAEIRTEGGEAVDVFWVTDVGGRRLVGEERIHELRVATTLIKQFTHLLPRSPDPGQALRQFNALIADMLSRPQWTAELANLEAPAVLETLADLMGVSRFLWEDFLRMQHENLFPVLLDLPALKEPRPPAELRDDLTRRLRALDTTAARVEALNAFKDREMFRIDLRHITGRSDFTEFADELSQLAEVVVATAAELAQVDLDRQFGAPRLADGRPCPWSIVALGKFGGGELCFGSDLELIVVYAGEGYADGPTPISNFDYFGRFVQTFRDMLRARREGIFEIDLRLRPHGKAGHFASTMAGFEQYYSAHGPAEQFERMALVRLRPVAGDAGLGERVVRARDAFVYSGRPLDLGNLRHLRGRQATELTPSGRVSAKYSAGGLVDIEYYVQAWQIAVGHADPAVRVTNTLAAIDRLTAGGHIPAERADQLRASYGFLRRLIDALRVVRGHAKDLTIPPASSREFAYLAHRLHYDSPAALQEVIDERMAVARSLWSESPPPGA
jgi:glutamate-ammonia-ligase adenylyltransferase